jgi:hypothetical protein
MHIIPKLLNNRRLLLSVNETKTSRKKSAGAALDRQSS